MSLSQRYKDFPPGWGHIMVPVSSRHAALAGLALYAPCRTRALWAQRLVWAGVRLLGPWCLPGPAVAWAPPAPDDVWEALAARWRHELGAFDDVAAYQRLGARDGAALLLLRGGTPVAFLKLRRGSAPALDAERRAVQTVSDYRPRSFDVPAPLAAGALGEWSYLAVSALPPRLHRPPAAPPLDAVLGEVEAALHGLPRPAGTPAHWRPMHGDFTPWNLRELDGRLVLLDWEDAAWAPPGADAVLYEASDAALHGRRAASSEQREAIRFWEERVGRRPPNTARHDRLNAALLAALRQMRDGAPARGVAALGARRTAVAPGERPARPRVLVFAYACEPLRGSEPGAGWGLVRAAVEFADCVVLVAPEHTAAIERWEAEHRDARLTFEHVGEPRWAPYAKWHRVTWFPLYMLWLRRAARVGRRLHAERPFDLTWHVTYSVYWLPSPATRFGVPSIWGPVGGGATTPLRLWRELGWRGVPGEILDWIAVKLLALLPATRRTWRTATVRLVQNAATLGRLPAALRRGTRVLNHALFTEGPRLRWAGGGGYVLFVGALESRKGARLALHALARAAAEVRLVMVGDGPDRAALQRLAQTLGVAQRVDFRGWLPRDQVFELLDDAAAALFTGLREEGGLALAEAMMCGAPVIVLANGGAGTVAAAGTDPTRVALVAPGGVVETTRRLGEAMTRFVRTPPAAGGSTLDDEQARRALRGAFDAALGVPAREPAVEREAWPADARTSRVPFAS